MHKKTTILILLVSLLIIPALHAEDEGERRPLKLVRSMPTPDGALCVEVYATEGDWPNEKVMVRNTKTGEKRRLTFGENGLPLQGTPLLSSGGNILVLIAGSGSCGTEPYIFRRGKDGWFKKVEMAGDSQENAWRCAVRAGRLPFDADPNHVYLDVFAVDEEKGLLLAAVGGNASFRRNQGEFKKGAHAFGPIGVCYDYNSWTWEIMKQLPKNWDKKAKPVRPAAAPVIAPGKKR
jgi:hypothetical protein